MTYAIRVYVVEDDQTHRWLLKRCLAAPEFSTSIFAQGQELLKSCAEKSPDIVLLDYALPDMSGLDILKAIRERDPDVAVLFLSAYTDASLIVRAMRMGARNYLPKDSDYTSELPDLIREVYREQEQKKATREALRKAKQDRSIILDNTSEMFIYYDPEFRIQWANQAAIHFTRSEGLDIHNQFCYQIWKNRNEPCPECVLKTVLETGKPSQKEKQDEEGNYWLIRGYPVLDDRQQLTGLIELRQDITELYHTRQELMDSENRLRTILETTSDGAWDQHLDTGDVFFTGNFWSSLGLNESLCNYDLESWLDRIHPEDRQRLEENMQMHLEQSVPLFLSEVRIKNGRDAWQWIQIKGRVADRDDSGNPRRIIGSYIDLTGFREIETERTKFHAAIEHAAEAIFITNPEGQIEYINPAFTRITGITKKETPGVSFITLFKDSFPVDKQQEMWKSLQDNKDWRATVKGRRPDGRVYTLNTAVATIRNKQNETMNYVGIGRDVTEENRIREQLQQAQKMEAIGTLAGGIAHDFNNILSVIMGYSEMIRIETEDNPEVQTSIGEVIQAGIRARDLVGQILTFSRKSQQVRKPLLIHLIIKEAMKMLRSSIPSTIVFDVSLASRAVVLADPTRIHQIMINLCTNAWHAMQDNDNGVLGVRLEDIAYSDIPPEPASRLKPGDYIRLTVSDTGHGMSPEIMERIFEPYFTTKEVNEGTGMGLSIVLGIIQSYDGTIDVSSKPGTGSVFSIYLSKEDRSGLKTESSPAKRIKTTPIIILLVDDEAAISKLHQKALSHFGYTVEAYTDSQKALQAFQNDPDRYDLVFSDLTMPGLTGINLARQVKRIRPNLPFVLCTGFSDRISQETIDEYGISFLTMKPVNFHDLIKKIESLLHPEKG